MFNNLKIGSRLGIGFISIIMILILLTLYGIRSMDIMSQQTTMIYDHPLTVSNAVLRINANIIKMHRSMKDVALSNDTESINKTSNLVNSLEKEVLKDFEIINKRYLGKKEEYELALGIFTVWKPIRDEVISLMHKGEREKAADITRDKGARHVEIIEKAMESLGNFAQNKAKDFLSSAETTKRNAFNMMYFLVGLTVFLTILLALFITKSFTYPIGILKQAAGKIGRGQLDTVIDIKSKDEIGQLATSFNEMAENLKNITKSRNERTADLESTIGLLNGEINERKQVEHALWESEERFRTIVEQSPFSTQILDADGRTIKVNRTWEDLWGLTLEDLRDYNMLQDKQLVNKEVIKCLNRAYSGETVFVPAIEYDASKTLGKGTSRWVKGCIYPIKDGEGSVRIVVVMHEDVTSQKNAEDALEKAKKEIETWNKELEKRVREKTNALKKSHVQLIQSEKLSAMGQMAGGLAHELNSPLAGLLPMIEQYRNEAEKGSKAYNELTLMLKACKYMAKIVKDFNSFSRESKGEYYELNLNEAIDDTLSLIASRIKQNGIKVIKEYKDNLPKVTGEKTELQQVILNMTTNALDALTEGDELILKTGISKDNKNIILEVIDNGIGIEKEDLDKIFDPFYTTKRPGKGTGLGLSVSYKIIGNHGGNISVESEPGKGTKFTIYLPAVKSNNA